MAYTPLARDYIPSPNWDSREGHAVRLIVLHTTVLDATPIPDYHELGVEFQDPAAKVSSHVGIDNTPNKVGEYVFREDSAWTAENANKVAIQAEMCATAAWTQPEWTGPNGQILINCAKWIFEEAVHFGIPLIKLTPEQAQGSGQGICQHRDLGTWGGNHPDCGDGFPIDMVISMAIALGTQGKAGGGPGLVQAPDGRLVTHVTPRAPKPSAAAKSGRTTHGGPKSDTGKSSQAAAAGTRAGQGKSDNAAPDAPTKPPNYKTVYGKPINAEHGLRYPPNFKFILVKPNGHKKEATNVINCSWEDNTAIMTGQIEFREPAIKTFDPWVKPEVGDRVFCAVDVHDGYGFQEIWLMRLKTASHQLESMTRTFDMTNDLELASESEGAFFFAASTAKERTATKQPGGWTGPQIITRICQDYGIPIGQLYPSKWIQPKLHIKRTSPLNAILSVVLREWRFQHRRLVVRFDRGRLTVLPMSRNPLLRQLGPSLVAAVFKENLLTEFASAGLVYGINEIITAASGDNFSKPKKKRNRMVVLRKSPPSISRFGYVQKILWSPDATSDAVLRQQGDAYLSVVAKPHRTLELTAPGIAYLKRGDAITLALGTDGLRKQLVWVNTLSQTVSPDQFLSTIEVIFDDPYILNSEMMKVWKLKSTRDEAIGNRERTNPIGWYMPKNNKGDGNQNRRSQQIIFNAAGDAVYGESTAEPAAKGGVTFGG